MESREIRCPKCNCEKGQHLHGKNESGSQRYRCYNCGKKYTPKPKGYTEEEKKQALKIYYSGVSARGVGKIFGMSKANVLNWIKKNEWTVDKSADEI